MLASQADRRRRAATAGLLLAIGLVPACQTESPPARFENTGPAVSLPTDVSKTRPIPARRVRQPGTFTSPSVHESSGLVRSQTHPGMLWTLNDSGNPPALFLIDTLGRNSGSVVLANGRNEDWEALSRGPCGSEWCLYIGDIGDNRSIRPTVRIYRLLEPTRADVETGRVMVRDSLTVRYANGPEDAEAMIVTPAGDAILITKGGRGVATAYKVPASAWARDSAVAEPIWRLPFRTSILLYLLARLVTDATLSADGQHLFVRTYNTIFRFGMADPGDPMPMQLEAACDIAGLDPQGEGIAWWDDTTLVLSSETTRLAAAPVTLLECAD